MNIKIKIWRYYMANLFYQKIKKRIPRLREPLTNPSDQETVRNNMLQLSRNWPISDSVQVAEWKEKAAAHNKAWDLFAYFTHINLPRIKAGRWIYEWPPETASYLGLNWTDLGQQNSEIQVRSIAYLGRNVVIAGTDSGRVLRSTNLGFNWCDLGRISEEAHVIHCICGTENGIVLAGTGPKGKILRSLDAGQTWVSLDTIFSQNTIYVIKYLESGVCLAGTGPDGKILLSKLT